MITTCSVARESFGRLPDGRTVERFTMRSAALELQAIDYGGIITSLRVPDRRGQWDDIVLGHDALDGYLTDPHYLGAIVGRYANRIARGQFQLDGFTHRLAMNRSPAHLHGGYRGFSAQVWTAAPLDEAETPGVRFMRLSPDGEEGYPGALDVAVTYMLTAPDELTISYVATADRPTIVNLTQHTYFNLGGRLGGSILDHHLTMNADRYTPVDRTLIPTGELAPVQGTPFDFRAAARIGPRLNGSHEQLRVAGGFDHNWVVNGAAGEMKPVARLQHKASGRRLDILSTEPGVQFYDGHLLRAPYAGLCLETQHFPDSPNRPDFPSVVLRPGEAYRSTTCWQFGAE